MGLLPGRQLRGALRLELQGLGHYASSDGDEIDWMYATYRIFSFTFELYPDESVGAASEYSSDSIIAGQTARNRGALLYLIDAAGCPYAAIGKAAQYFPLATPA
jgi:hypothetical protein